MANQIVRKLTTKTAAAAAIGALALSGAGTAGAQDLSSVPSVASLNVSDYVDTDRLGELNATVLGGASGKAAEQRASQSSVLTTLPADAQPLPKSQAQRAVTGLLEAKQSQAMTVELRADGTLTYSDGCNSGNGLYTIDDAGALHVSGLSETRVMCDSATMNNAAALKSVLQSAPAVYQVNGGVALGSAAKAIEFTKAAAQ